MRESLSTQATSAPPTWCSKGALVLSEREAAVGGGGAKQARGGARRRRGCAEQTARPGRHRVGWALPARLVVLKSQLLQGYKTESRQQNLSRFQLKKRTAPTDPVKDQQEPIRADHRSASSHTSRDLFSYSFMAVMHWCFVLMLVVTPAFTIVSLPVGG